MSRPVTILLTGFEPFDGEPVNPAQQLVEALAHEPAPHPRLQLVTAILPVDRRRCPAHLDAAVEATRPDAVVAIGQATGRPRIDLETRAFNQLDFGEGTDNGGHAAHGEPLAEDGPPHLDSTLPWPALASDLADRGHPVGLSADAGRHLCNALLYDLLHRHPRSAAGFVHVPLLPDQAARRALGEPHLAPEVSLAVVRELLRALTERLAHDVDAWT